MIARVACLNDDCVLYGIEEDARATFEGGLYFLADDDRIQCVECGEAVSVLGARVAL